MVHGGTSTMQPMIIYRQVADTVMWHMQEKMETSVHKYLVGSGPTA